MRSQGIFPKIYEPRRKFLCGSLEEGQKKHYLEKCHGKVYTSLHEFEFEKAESVIKRSLQRFPDDF